MIFSMKKEWDAVPYSTLDTLKNAEHHIRVLIHY